MSKPSLNSPVTNDLLFDLTPEDITRRADVLKTKTKDLLDGIANLKEGEHTFANTILAINHFDGIHGPEESSIDFLQYVSSDSAVRDASKDASTMLQEFAVECSMRLDVFLSLKAFAESFDVKSLTETEQRLIEFTLRDYKRNGLDLSEEKRTKLTELKKQLTVLASDYQKNLNEEVTKIFLTKEQLAGVSDDFINSLDKTDEGKFIVTLKYPHLIPILQKCTVPETRKLLDFKNSSKCNEANVALLEETLVLRRQVAQLLGKEDHASHILELRMAKKPQIVIDFLNELSSKLDAPMKKEMEVWKKLKAEAGEANADTIYSYDWTRFHTVNLDKNYQVDDEQTKPYFPLDVVTNGMLGVYEDLLSIRFAEIKDPLVWHEEVRMFAVHDSETSAFMGHFYLDLHPRDGKYGHAAAFPLVPRYKREDGTIRSPVTAMVANFTKPGVDKPSLLKFNEVVTYFHELGHVLHGMCTRAELPRFSGTSVERDFVEAPSQMLENWCYEEEVLHRISGHYEDNSKKLPSEILKKLVAAKNADTGLMNKRQIFFGVFDQTIHSSTDEKIDSYAIYSKLRKDITNIAQPENANSAASFGHIMGGYDASYYGYLWSQVYSADMFEHFKKHGVMSKEQGKRYRDIILAHGGQRDSIVSLEEFLGRKPTQEAFLRSIGIAE